MAKFELCLEEGYDLPDPEYLQWLELNHPDALPSEDESKRGSRSGRRKRKN